MLRFRQELVAFGGRIRMLRKARGLTQSQLARSAGLSGRFIGLVERGGNPSLSAILSLARALDVPIAELFSGSSGNSHLQKHKVREAMHLLQEVLTVEESRRSEKRRP